jgi:hypothetical protein
MRRGRSLWPFRSSPAEPRHPLLDGVAAGGARFERLVLTRNSRVMASATDRGRTLRLHESFRDAPPEVLRALGELFSARSSAKRAAARTRIRGYVESLPTLPASRARRPAKLRREDLPHLQRLRAEFAAVNARYFEGRLPEVPIRLSGRMRRRNGHFNTEPLEIAISRTLCTAAATGEAERTLRHEMVHLWQWSEGRKPGHGEDFRRWARLLDIHPRATRPVCWTVETS